ncbi:GyrI-like domain-containing protein [Treponema peruense]|uniref:GyrI-like domain-containing protein n=1 Tax=Treponema peruense TaxID=2787628 RepID=UPI0039EE1C81
MDYKIDKMESFKVIGFSRVFNMKTSYTEIPKFWDEVYEKYSKQLCEGKDPQTPVEKAIVENQIGMFGICIEDGKDGNFNYMIAGCYKGGDVPAEMTTYQLPECEWQSLNVQALCPVRFKV